MSKVQEYLKRKKIEQLGLPKLYIVKSSPESVEIPVERQVVNIVENVAFRRYELEGSYPYQVDVLRGETSSRDDGYGSGFGDLWGWTYFSSFSKEEIEKYYEAELLRVHKTYMK